MDSWAIASPADKLEVTPLLSIEGELDRAVGGKIAKALIDADYSSKACNWLLARQDAKEHESSEDGKAGRMTATARADIGARFQARPKRVDLGLRTDV